MHCHSFRAGEPAGPSKPLATFEGPPCQNRWSHASLPQRSHLGPRIHSHHSHGLDLSASWGLNPKPKSAPKGPFQRGLVLQCWGLGTNEPQPQNHTPTRPPPGPTEASPIIQGGRMGRALRATSSLEGPPCQNPWAHAPLPQHPHLGPSLCSPDSRQFGPASLLGANPNLRSAPEGPFPRGLAPQLWVLWTLSTSTRLTSARPPPRPIGAPRLIQGGRTGRVLRAPGDL